MDLTQDVGLAVERRAAALWLRLDRPRRRNALTVELASALADAVLGAPGPGVSAIVLTGSPPAFCAGGDLLSLGAVAERGATAVTDVVYGQFHRLVTALADSPLPVIAAINGAAMGAGLDLALACDLRYASEDAILASSWITVGLVPGMGGAHLLTRAVGATRAAEMVLTGAPVTAAAAAACGLINAAVPADQLATHVEDVAGQLAGLPPVALARSKAALRRAVAAGFEAELAALGAVQGGLLTGQEFQVASARFRRPRETSQDSR
jgi:2-(1,2-epoxy-1,2-dihydrophenyl)acetyl-CoA isomerase